MLILLSKDLSQQDQGFRTTEQLPIDKYLLESNKKTQEQRLSGAQCNFGKFADCKTAVFKNLHSVEDGYCTTLSFFISNQDQTAALKAAYVFGVQNCLIVVQWFDQVTYVCEKCNNFQDSKSIFMITDFKTSLVMLLRQLNFGALSVY